MFYDDRPMDMAVPPLPPPFAKGSRKRGYNDWDDPNANVQNGGGHAFGGRPVKQPRRGRRDSRSDTLNKWYREGMSAAMTGQVPYAQGAPGPAAVGYFNPQNGAVGGPMFGMGMATGHPLPDFLGGGHFPPGKKRKKCRDFEKKGFCPRGTSCTFAHSNDPGYGGPPGPPFGGMPMMPQQSSAGDGRDCISSLKLDFVANSDCIEYDPANALMPDLLNGQSPFSGQMPMPIFGQQQRHRGGKHQNRQRRADKAAFSADGPVFDKTKSTIVVENIPEESFTEDQVKSFFSQFGSVVDVSMRPYKRLAVVKFDNWTAANAAYQSPKVIFDNRFVKVFWYKDDASTAAGSAGGGSGTTKPKHARGLPEVDGHEAGSQPEIDLDEFAKQQEERQKAFEEKTKKRENLERQREELEKRQQELLAKHLEEKAKLQVKLGSSNGSKIENGGDDTKKPMSQSEALRAQLAALEAQAREMGIDPDDPDTSASWTPRGGSSGRGRGGGWRGSPSPYTPRGSFRGGYRGRASVHAAYAAYSLDNRPRKVALTGVDFTASDKDETLRQYLFVSSFCHFQRLGGVSPPSWILIVFRESANLPTFKPDQLPPRSRLRTGKQPRNFSTRSFSLTRSYLVWTLLLRSIGLASMAPPVLCPPRRVCLWGVVKPAMVVPMSKQGVTRGQLAPTAKTTTAAMTTAAREKKGRSRATQEVAAIRTCTSCLIGRPMATITITTAKKTGSSARWTTRLQTRKISGDISSTCRLIQADPSNYVFV